MLSHLSIKNIVLIESLELEFASGLSVMTGETGAGKSILLDALGLALGSRADFSLIRKGTDRASVSATFETDINHPVWQLLDAAGITPAEQLILRRQLKADGKSHAHINDQPVSVNLLRQCGDMLVEIQGQFEGRGLLDISTHISLLDRFAGAGQPLITAKKTWQQYKTIQAELFNQQEIQAKAREEEDWLRDAVEQLDRLNPVAGEEEQLSQERSRHAHSARIAQALQESHACLADEAGIITLAGRAQTLLERQSEVAGGLLEDAISAMDKALAELNEAEAQIRQAADRLESDPERLAIIEDRLYSLRAAARKHKIETDELAGLHEQLARKLAALDDQSGLLTRLAEQAETARQDYIAAAEKLSQLRKTAATQIDQAVMEELPPLKLETARFGTEIMQLEETSWSGSGWDKVRFRASTNPGSDMGGIDKIASGGELARFLLALKVVLSGSESPKTLIFDEVDSGVGGAVAAAVGSRLARLGHSTQTLVITHSPQVAGKGTNHFKIAKTTGDSGVISVTRTLNHEEQIEEIARMLSADEITQEARAVARNLLGSDL